MPDAAPNMANHYTEDVILAVMDYEIEAYKKLDLVEKKKSKYSFYSLKFQ